MWYVTKHNGGRELDRTEIPANDHAALINWYTAEGTEEDEKIGVRLVQHAKTFELWLACECLGSQAAPPLLSPAYLSEAETYYLRRLTGSERPEHRQDCPFFREQVLADRARAERAGKPLAPVDGFFAALKPIGEHLAQKPDDSAEDSRLRGPSTPRLARLLWDLIERAETNIIEAIGQRGKPGIAVEYQRIKAAATDLWIAPRVPLAAHLYTHPDDLRSKKIYARLRQAADKWPETHEPQAFLAVYATSVTRRELILPTGDPILIASDITKPAAKHVDRGPYLVLVAIGEHSQARGYAAVRAYAQPIQDGRHFAPVDSNAERQFLAILLELQWQLHASNISVRMKKPVFDLDTELGPCRPDFMLDILDRRSRARRLLCIELMGYATEAYQRAKDVTVPRMRTVAPVLEVAIAELDDTATLSLRLERAIADG